MVRKPGKPQTNLPAPNVPICPSPPHQPHSQYTLPQVYLTNLLPPKTQGDLYGKNTRFSKA